MCIHGRQARKPCRTPERLRNWSHQVLQGAWVTHWAENKETSWPPHKQWSDPRFPILLPHESTPHPHTRLQTQWNTGRRRCQAKKKKKIQWMTEIPLPPIPSSPQLLVHGLVQLGERGRSQTARDRWRRGTGRARLRKEVSHVPTKTFQWFPNTQGTNVKIRTSPTTLACIPLFPYALLTLQSKCLTNTIVCPYICDLLRSSLFLNGPQLLTCPLPNTSRYTPCG